MAAMHASENIEKVELRRSILVEKTANVAPCWPLKRSRIRENIEAKVDSKTEGCISGSIFGVILVEFGREDGGKWRQVGIEMAS